VLNVLTVEEARLQKLFDEAGEKRRSVDATREFYSQTLRRKETELQGVDASEYQAEEALAAVRRARPQLLAEIKQIKDLLISCGKATGFAHSFNPNDAPLSVIMPVIR
jgi:2-iminoacetate synthase ThiH